jgi:hypothetical protein
MAIFFDLVEVLKTKDNYHFIEWDVSFDGGETVNDYNFQIWWSNDPESGFIAAVDALGDIVVVDGAVGPLTFTQQRKHNDFNKDYYYFIKAIRKSDSAETNSEPPVFYNNTFNGVHDTIRYAEAVLKRNYDGEPVKILKRKSWGNRCPDCWSPELRQIIKSHCTTCLGTGFIVGYYQAIPIQVAFDSDPKKSDSQQNQENVFDTKRARMSNYPLVRPKDIIINQDDNKRYRIKHVETTKLPKLSESKTVLSKMNYIISQILTLEELVTTDVEYSIDIDGIPEVPQSEAPAPVIPPTHPPVTTEAPLTIDGDQFLQLLYDANKFEINANDELTLTDPLCTVAVNVSTAGEVLPSPYKVVYSDNSGTVSIADSSDINHMNRVMGIALNAAGGAGIAMVQRRGKLTEATWSWTLGRSIFFDANGDLTQTPPTSGFWMILGRPITSTQIEVNLETPVKKA